METIHLPARLFPNAQLAELNRRLRAGEITLDWSEVSPDLPPAPLAVLLEGLDLVEHFDVIGAATVPDALLALFQTALSIDVLDDGEETGKRPAVPATPGSVLRVPSPSELRSELEEMVIRELLGPAGGADEEVHEHLRVRDRYLVGMLAPATRARCRKRRKAWPCPKRG